MLQSLGAFYNWQTAFLQAFHPDFQTLLEVEKWWAVHAASFTGRDPWQTWRADVGLEKLSQALRLPAQVEPSTNSGPVTLELKPQQVIQELDFGRQRQFLNPVIAQLHALRLQTAPELLALTDEYRAVLTGYLERRAQAGYAPPLKNQVAPSVKSLVREAVQRLDGLDATRLELQRRLGQPPPLPSDS
jgi:hypothetical protein